MYVILNQYMVFKLVVSLEQGDSNKPLENTLRFSD